MKMTQKPLTPPLRLLHIFFILAIVLPSEHLAFEIGIKKVIETHELNSIIGTPGLIIIDARNKGYESGHIKTSRQLSMRSTYRSSAPTYLMGTIKKLKGLISQVGAKNGSKIVIYDDGSQVNAARVWLIFKLFGFDSISLLNGGFRKWVLEKRTISTKTPIVSPSQFEAQINPQYLSNQLDVQLAIGKKDSVLIDTRKKNEYLGKKSMANRSGHIPTAVNVPWTENLNLKNGSYLFKAVSDLKKIYYPILKNKKKVTTYCNWGEHSALAIFSLELIGYTGSSYDGSWLQWGNDDSLQIEQ